MKKTLEDRFNEAAGEWMEHCRKNAHQSIASFFFSDCDAYKKMVSLGTEVLPLVRDQLQKEYDLNIEYGRRLDAIKMRIFGTEDVELSGDNYRRISKDKEFKELNKKGPLTVPWVRAVAEIIGEDFVIPEEIRGRVTETDQYTIHWLDQHGYGVNA
ncbi:MAG: hypothetical protein RL557_7 [archaeon]|jgi:hypothetical protein